jgi:AAA15 family ATPase/GTPase
MQITLKNVGYIEEATVNLTGLSVIAGLNGTGKSTVGKTAYTIIKSISDCDNIVTERRKMIVDSLCRAVFYSIQNNLKRHSSGTRNNNDVKLLLDSFNSTFASMLTECLVVNEYERAKELVISNISLVDSFVSLDDKSKLSTKRTLNDLLNVFTYVDSDDAIKQSLEFMYQEIFRGQINNLGSHKTSKVFLDNDGDNLDYSVSNNSDVLPFSDRLKVYEIGKNLKQRIFPKSTFIETPLILQVINSVNLPFHWKDLINKLKYDARSVEPGVSKWVYDEISKVLGGELVYVTDKQDFYFVPHGTDNKLYVSNMASGEKMFGILQKLAKLGLLSSDHLLIFDEPENHLHPQWQVKLAEILVTLVENNVSILLTTHSATLIDALQEFAEAKDLLNKTNFYFADLDKKTIENVENMNTDGKDIIFKSFYEANKLLPDLKHD